MGRGGRSNPPRAADALAARAALAGPPGQTDHYAMGADAGQPAPADRVRASRGAAACALDRTRMGNPPDALAGFLGAFRVCVRFCKRRGDSSRLVCRALVFSGTVALPLMLVNAARTGVNPPARHPSSNPPLRCRSPRRDHHHHRPILKTVSSSRERSTQGTRL
jgi:hypothetical protein